MTPPTKPTDQTEAGPVAPAKKPFESKLNPLDLTLGEKSIFDAMSSLIGALVRVHKQRKYITRLIARLNKEDAGNPLTPYIDTIAGVAEMLSKQVDQDPEFQAGLEAAERRMFMERFGGGMIG